MVTRLLAAAAIVDASMTLGLTLGCLGALLALRLWGAS